MAEIRLSFLDQIRIVQGGEDVAGRMLPRKFVALLGLLSAEGTRASSVDRLLLLLWPEIEKPNARKSLNQLLVRGRRVMPGALVRPTEDLVGLSPEVVCDVFDLLSGDPFRSGRTPGPGTRFEFLPGFSVRGCPQLNDWLDNTRAMLWGRAAKAALERTRGLTPVEAFPWASLAYRLDRADERTATTYFGSVSAARGPAAAWAAFTEHRRWLADELDMLPSARLTAAAAEASRQPGVRLAGVAPAAIGAGAGVAPVPAESPDLSRNPLVAAAGARRSGWRLPRGLQLAGSLAVTAVLSVIVWQTMGTPAAQAGTGVVDVVLTVPSAEIGDSALRLAAAHLAHEGVAADVVEHAGAAVALRLAVPGWRGNRTQNLAFAPLPQPTADRLAAAVVDSALSLVRRNAPEAAAAGARREPESRLLRDAHAALATASTLIATGGEGAALVMLERADSLADRASHVRGTESQGLVLQAEIANQAFWNKLAAGIVDPDALRKGITIADAAVRREGGVDARRARASLSFSMWVFGASGADTAGQAAQRDYAAVVASSPGDGVAWSRLAQLYHADGRLSDAYSAALHALPLVAGPDRMETFMQLFLAALDRRDNRTAKHWCAEIGFHHDDSWFAAACAAMYAWADPANMAGKVQSALLQESSTLRPALESQLMLLTAGAELARGNDSAALRKIALARPSVDRDPQLASIWAGILVELGQPDSALSTLRAYLKGSPSRRLVVGRPWLQPLYRPHETWQEFLARLGAEAAAMSDQNMNTERHSAPLLPTRGPAVRDVDAN